MPSGNYPRKSLVDRFWEKVLIIDDEDSCWEWQASLFDSGYGQFCISNKKDSKQKKICAHRMAYKLSKGEIPENLLVLHTCDNRKCVRPKHLFTGSYQDNADDMIAKGRSHVGSKHGMAKLTDDIVKLIRNSQDTPSIEAKKWGITRNQVSNVRNRKSWKHVK